MASTAPQWRQDRDVPQPPGAIGRVLAGQRFAGPQAHELLTDPGPEVREQLVARCQDLPMGIQDQHIAADGAEHGIEDRIAHGRCGQRPERGGLGALAGANQVAPDSRPPTILNTDPPSP